jgi:CheY-like chemotaxis protein
MACQMPVLDGFAAAEQIRMQEGAGQHTPIIAMTASAMQGDRERCLAAGMDDSLPKPVPFAMLREKLAHWLPATSDIPSVSETVDEDDVLVR